MLLSYACVPDRLRSSRPPACNILLIGPHAYTCKQVVFKRAASCRRRSPHALLVIYGGHPCERSCFLRASRVARYDVASARRLLDPRPLRLRGHLAQLLPRCCWRQDHDPCRHIQPCRPSIAPDHLQARYASDASDASCDHGLPSDLPSPSGRQKSCCRRAASRWKNGACLSGPLACPRAGGDPCCALHVVRSRRYRRLRSSLQHTRTPTEQSDAGHGWASADSPNRVPCETIR